METRINRRQALVSLGGVSLGGLLAACSGDDDSSASSSTSSSSTTASTTSTTGSGTESTGAASLAGRFEEAATCSATPEETEGPYWFDVDSIRSDIREDREGAVLRLGVRVLDVECTPLPDVAVEVWHCDAAGLYSGFEEASQGGPGGGRTDEETYLRGTQITDANGIVEFTTIYPGWYRGRTIHVHAKVHVTNTAVLTTQFYFDDAFSAQVLDDDPYASDAGRDTFNENDGLYLPENLLTLSEEGNGYLGLLNVTVDSP